MSGYLYGNYEFKLYKLLAEKGISHNRFILDTGTGYATMRRYANGTVKKIDLEVIDRWCHYLNCEPEDIVSYQKKPPTEDE